MSGRDLRQGCRFIWSSKPVRAGLGAMAVALIVFHVWLLWKSVTDQSLYEPVVAIKWLTALFLVGALWRLRKSGHLALRGHRAGVFWLLVLLLHVQLPLAPITEDAVAVATEVTASGWLWALPATVSLSASFALAIGLFWFGFGRALERAPRRSWSVTVHRLGSPVTGTIPALACRPPPLSF
jgi:hypothetical protein